MQSASSRFAAMFLAALTALSIGTIATRAKSGSTADAGNEAGARLKRVEAIAVELPSAPGEASLRLNLSELMKTYNVPGLSIAVIENYKIVDVKAYGVLAPGSTTPVTTRTLFQAGSISKPVAATGALYLVERKKLALDENVNDQLKTWKVPDNEFTKTEKVAAASDVAHRRTDHPWISGLRRGRAASHTCSDFQRRETGEYGSDPGRYCARDRRALFRRRSHDRAADGDRCYRQGFPSIHA
jgi:hypothetical protein